MLRTHIHYCRFIIFQWVSIFVGFVDYILTYMATPRRRNPASSKAVKYTILVDPSLVIITKNLVSLILDWE